MGQFVQKNAATIALIVAIIALVSSLVPQINDFCSEGSTAVAVKGGGAGPKGGPGGPMGGGPGGGRGGFGGPMGGGPGVSEEYKAKLAERVGLYDAALKSAQGDEILKLRLERDLAKLNALRAERGARRFGASISDLLLKKLAFTNCPRATALEKNQVELDYIQALDRFRGDKLSIELFAETLKDYPRTPATDDQLKQLLDAETPAPMGF